MIVVVTTVIGFAGLPAFEAFATSNATVSASEVSPVSPGTTEYLGDLDINEQAVGQLAVGDVITAQLKDSLGGATLHLTSTPTVSGSNGLAATLAVASSSGTLQDEVVVTITQASSGSFPGVLTVSQLDPTIDSGAAAGNVSMSVSDSNSSIAASGSPQSVAIGNVVTSGTARGTYVSVTEPTLASTGSGQAAGSVTIDEPAKDFFHTGDVITFRVRDANGSSDTVGLAGTPSASGGAMAVSVHGLNGSSVQPNETGFKVSIDGQDPSNGSASTLTITNISLNTAQAPSGPILLSAVVTTGSTSELIVPGRVEIAQVGGNTTTTSAGTPALTVPGTSQVAGNVTITAAAGSLHAGDTFSLAIQEAGVTFTAAGPPQASLTSGNLSLTSSAAAIDAGDVTATWTVQNPNTVPTTIVIGPIYYDVASGATVGHTVAVRTSGGGAFDSQTVTNATLTTGTAGMFLAASAPPVSTSSSSPVVEPGVDVHYVEAAAGSLPANNSAIVLLSPYASQIAAYRTTFTAAPSAVVTGNLVLGAPIVNSQTIAVTTANGVVSAPARTAVIYPVTTASTGTPAQVTFSGISYQLGNFVPPGALLGTGTANTGTGVLTSSSTAVGGTSVDGNTYADAINGNGLGSAAAGDTTPPETYIDGGPANGSTVYNTSTVTFYFHSSEDPFATFTCTLISHTDAGDSSTVFENNCGQPSGNIYSKTYPSLANGNYTFYVQATDAANNTDPTPASSSFSVGFDNTPPTASINTPATAGSLVVVSFSEPVKSVAPADVTLSPATSGGSTLTCYNGTTPANCLTGPVTAATVKASPYLIPGQSYVVTANPAGAVAPITDLAGNPLAQTSKTFRASVKEQESSVAATYHDTWPATRSTHAAGGRYVATAQRGASASFTFSGTSITWVTVTGAGMGRAAVYVDGVKKATIDNYSSTTKYGVKRLIKGLSKHTHSIKIVVLGTHRSGATGSKVAVDEWLVG
jgi:hypothetical protein